MTYAELSSKATANVAMLHDLATYYRQLVRNTDNRQTIEALQVLAADAEARAAQVESGTTLLSP